MSPRRLVVVLGLLTAVFLAGIGLLDRELTYQQAVVRGSLGKVRGTGSATGHILNKLENHRSRTRQLGLALWLLSCGAVAGVWQASRSRSREREMPDPA